MILIGDVSEYSGANVNFGAFAREGGRGFYVEAQRGNDGPNRLFAEQVRAIKAAGMAAGAYHLAYPLPDSAQHPNRDPAGQIELFYEASGGLGEEDGDLPPMLDCESPDPSVWTKWGVTQASAASWIAEAASQVDQQFCRPCGIYCDPAWWRALGGAGLQPCFKARAFWLAAYPIGGLLSKPPTMAVTPPAPWNTATMWQFTGQDAKGGGFVVPGAGPVDGSVFLGDEAAWQTLLKAS